MSALNQDPSFQVNEDYSEQTRVQADVNTAMSLGSSISTPMVAGVPEGILALSEAERSGMSHLHY